MGLQKRGKQRNVSTNKTSSLVVGHTKHGIFPWAQGAFSACLKRSKDSWKRHAKWKRRNHQKNCEGRQICINHMVCHHPPLVKQLIFSILVGFWNFFWSISPFALHQFYRRNGSNIRTLKTWGILPWWRPYSTDLDHHSFSISKLEVCPNKSKLSQFDDFLRMIFWIGWKECPPV